MNISILQRAVKQAFSHMHAKRESVAQRKGIHRAR